MRDRTPRRVVPIAAFLTLVSLLGATPAAAQFTLTDNSGSSEVRTTYGPGGFLPPRTIPGSFGPFGGVALSDLDVSPFGRLRAVQTGIGLNAVAVDARLQDTPSYAWGATTRYDVTAANAGSQSTSLDFQYHLNGGRLELLDPSLRFRSTVARVSVSIFAISPGFGGFLWWWDLVMQGDGSGNVTVAYNVTADPLGLGLPALGPVIYGSDRATVAIGAFTGGANFGRVQPGSDVLVSYVMDAQVSGVGFGEGGVARLGDPYDLSGNYGAGFTLAAAAPTAVPEPTTVWLLAGGLALACLATHRIRAIRVGE